MEKTIRKVFDRLLDTIKHGARENKAEITNVELFINSWKREMDGEIELLTPMPRDAKRFFMFSAKYTVRDRKIFLWKRTEFKNFIHIGDDIPRIETLMEQVEKDTLYWREPLFIFGKLRVTNVTILSFCEFSREEHNKFWLDNQ